MIGTPWRIGLRKMDNIFEFGKWDITTEIFMDSKIITIENFYKYPDLVKEFTINPLPNLWKAEHGETRNGCFYFDRRSQIDLTNQHYEQHKRIFDIFSQLIGQPIGENSGNYRYISNVTKFLKHSFNNIDECYWWPHRDKGYNAIVSLNDEFGESEYPGTALFHPEDEQAKTNEGVNPWVLKKDFNLVKDLKARYNKCVLFDGLKFPHAMHINDYRFFDEFYRVNTVLFFND